MCARASRDRLGYVLAAIGPGDVSRGAAAFGTLGHDRPWSKSPLEKRLADESNSADVSADHRWHFVKNITNAKESI